MESPLKPIVFISCGQYSEKEKQIGRAIAKLVDEMTEAQGYFAENQSSLEGLSQKILGALNQCVGFIAVMHHRGTVKTLAGSHIRASVWVEQELAIASFLVQAQGRTLPVAAYIQRDVKREGIREQLLLGAVEFSSDDEILADLRNRLGSSRFQLADRAIPVGPRLQASIGFKLESYRDGLHQYLLIAAIANAITADEPASDYWFELEFPRLLMETHVGYANEIASRGTKTHRLFRWDRQPKLYPGDTTSGTINYFMNDDLFYEDMTELLEVTLRLGSPGHKPVVVQKKIKELNTY